MLLTRQTEALLARRAERTGGGVAREAYLAFRRRWARAPEAEQGFGESGLRALAIDERAPSQTRDAGSAAILSHMRALRALGYSVAFAAFDGESGDFADEDAIAVLGRPHYACVEDVLRRHAGSFDLVYLHRLASAERYLKLVQAYLPRARVVYSVGDLHHLRLGRQARVERRPELLAFARATEHGEMYAASQADLVFTHSPVEAQILSRHIGQKTRVVPFALGERRSPPPFAERQGVAFLGSFEHSPNADAAYWLVREILPRVWRQAPGLTCKIAGHGWRADALGALDARVEIVGPVEDLDDLFGEVRLTVAPLRFGAGIKGKVLDSFAAGLPCVMSDIAAEGLPLAGPLIEHVARDAEDFAQLILRLHDDEAANAAAGLRARATAALFSQANVIAALRAALARSTGAVHALAGRKKAAPQQIAGPEAFSFRGISPLSPRNSLTIGTPCATGTL
jgi:glycosyltransferase involved in cell wall biosynthesis